MPLVVQLDLLPLDIPKSPRHPEKREVCVQTQWKGQQSLAVVWGFRRAIGLRTDHQKMLEIDKGPLMQCSWCSGGSEYTLPTMDSGFGLGCWFDPVG